MTDSRQTENAALGGTGAAVGSPRNIGRIANYYGGLSVKSEGAKFYWGIENYDGIEWEEIPASLFRALNAFEDSKANDKAEVLE